MSVKNGPVTLLSVVQTVDGKLKLLSPEGESLAGPILKIGNTNSRLPILAGSKNVPYGVERSGPGPSLRGGRWPHFRETREATRSPRNGICSGLLR
jgi:hypothetical protein